MLAGDSSPIGERITMFYYLLLAHLLADYPLQPTWIVTNKNRRGVVLLHALIHFLISLFIVWFFSSASVTTIWPYLLILAAVHLFIDLSKITLSRIRPDWVKVPYLLDQLMHILSIVFISLFIQTQYGFIAFPPNPGWVVLAIAYLFVTYVWYISERVMTYDDPIYRQAVIDDSWSRMIFRAGFLSAFLGIWLWTTKTLAASAGAILFPYQTKKFGRRALLIDLGVSLSVFFLLILVFNPSF